MASQDNSNQNPFGSSNQYGADPAQAQLPPQREQMPVSYAPAKGAALASYANSFIQGLQRGQAAKYLRSEQEKAEKERHMDQYYAHSMADPTLSPEGKQAVEKAYLQAKFGAVQEGLKGAKDQKDNPLIHLARTISGAVLGPGENKKHQDMDVNSLMSIGNNPQYRVNPSQTEAQAMQIAGGGQGNAQPTQPIPGANPAVNRFNQPVIQQTAAPQANKQFADQAQFLADPDNKKAIQFYDSKHGQGSWQNTQLGAQFAALPKATATPQAAPKVATPVTAEVPQPDGSIKRQAARQEPDGKVVDPSTGKVIPGAYVPTAGLAAQTRADAAPKTGNMQHAWVQIPGGGNPVLGFFDPKNPSGYKDVNGNPIANAQPVATPTQGSGMAAQYKLAAEAELKRSGVENPTDDQIKTRAGEIIDQVLGTTQAGKQQAQAVKAEMTGIGPGAGLTGTGAGTPKPTGKPPSIDSKSSTGETLPAPKTQVPPRTSATSSGIPPAFKSKSDLDNANLWFQSEVNGLKTPGMGLRVTSGQRAAQEATGLDPGTFVAETNKLKGDMDALKNISKSADLYSRIPNMLKEHGDVFVNAAKQLKDKTYGLGDSPLKNATVQWFDANVGPHPELQRYREAIQAVAREQAQLLSGGITTNSRLPVQTSAKGDATFPPNMTFADILAGVDQLKVEAEASKRGYNTTKKDVEQRIADNPISKALKPPSSGKSAQPQAQGADQIDGSIQKNSKGWSVGQVYTPTGKKILGFTKDGHMVTED